MGKRCYPVIRTWVTGRDVHTHFDVALAEWWLEHAARSQHPSREDTSGNER